MSQNLFDALTEELPGMRLYSRSDGSKYMAGICPWHEDTRPSLLVFEDDRFNCLACGRRGNHSTLLNELRRPGYSAVEPIRIQWDTPKLPETLAGLQPFINSCHLNLVDSEYIRAYLKSRGVEGRIESNRLGFYRGWYVVPVLSREGTIAGAVLRAGPEIQKVTGLRFIVPQGQKPMMFVPDWRLFKSSSRVAIVFGIFDALAVSDLRYPVVTTTSGKDSFRDEWLEEERAKSFVVIPDAGEEDTAMKLANRIGLRGSVARLDYPDGCKDPADYLANGRREELDNALRKLL